MGDYPKERRLRECNTGRSERIDGTQEITVQTIFDQLEDAVSKAIDECIANDILADFFYENKAEVLKMAVLDFTFERREKLIARDNYEEGLNKGLVMLVTSLSKRGVSSEEILKEVKEYEDYKDISLQDIKDIMSK